MASAVLKSLLFLASDLFKIISLILFFNSSGISLKVLSSRIPRTELITLSLLFKFSLLLLEELYSFTMLFNSVIKPGVFKSSNRTDMASKLFSFLLEIVTSSNSSLI